MQTEFESGYKGVTLAVGQSGSHWFYLHEMIQVFRANFYPISYVTDIKLHTCSQRSEDVQNIFLMRSDPCISCVTDLCALNFNLKQPYAYKSHML